MAADSAVYAAQGNRKEAVLSVTAALAGIVTGSGEAKLGFEAAVEE
jgi:hypothetical protein